jgi:CheY-like chemotaxis protein
MLPTCAAVLVVEDERENRELIVDHLKSEGFQVYQAGTCQEALTVLQIMPEPALILADLMAPVIDGRSLIAGLRADDRFATLPMVVVSAADGAGAEEGRRIKKPIDLADVVQIVSGLCLRRT